MPTLSETTEDPFHPRAHDFRHRSANYFAVQSLESLMLRGVIASWMYEPSDNLFAIRTHGRSSGPLMLNAKQVETFEVGAVAVINAVVVNGLTVEEIYKGIGGLKQPAESASE